MNPIHGSDPGAEQEHLDEFRFLFEDLHHASAAHPAPRVLDEYVRGIRPKGPDAQGWQSHAVSAHLGLCPTCRVHVERLRRQRIRLLGRERTHPWRPAYQYLGIILLISGLLAVYSFMRSPPGELPPAGPGGHVESPSSGLARLR
jgi:hypothetical protein